MKRLDRGQKRLLIDLFQPRWRPSGIAIFVYDGGPYALVEIMTVEDRRIGGILAI